MALGKHDFDWLLDHARAIAFDPGRLSLYAFGMDAEAEDLRQQVLAPMNGAGCFLWPTPNSSWTTGANNTAGNSRAWR